MMRLQKYLSAAGVCSRRRGEELISQGLVKVNGEKVTQLGTSINPELDRVEVAGQVIRKSKALVYIMLNKPKGYITSRSHRGEKIVFDLVDVPERLNPVGRLDKDSTGLLILTNDGELHNRLIHPSFDHEKEYEVKVANFLDDRALEALRAGVVFEDQKTRPATVKRLGEKLFRIILKEGRKRQIRRMVEVIGNQVTALHRVRMSTLYIGDLKTGQWRYLTPKEISALQAAAGIPAAAGGEEKT
jgi:23S rRNA pseudouridine2605 synthase/23S rRNA pseudouridine2604 synthase